MKQIPFLLKISKMLNPAPEVGALSFSDSGVRFFMLRPGNAKPVTATVSLPPGIIESGKIKDINKLTTALKQIKSQIGDRGMSSVIALLPEEVVYTQPFSTPLLEEEKMEESALLNLQMLSPIDFSGSYAAWQKIGERFSGTAQVDLLGAVAERVIVDAYTKAMSDAGFVIAAVEFPGLALARAIHEGKTKEEGEKSFCITHISGEGVLFLIVQEGNLYFSQFHSWRTLREEQGGKELSEQDFQLFIEREAQKVLNFYQSRWGKPVDALLIGADNMTGKIIDILKNSAGTTVEALTLPAFKGTPHAWLPIVGSALRGRMPRSEDSSLSLADHSVKERYEEARMISFLHTWRSVVVATLAILLIFFGVADAFIAQKVKDVQKNVVEGNPADRAEITSLQSEAKEFNAFISLIDQATKEATNIDKLLALVLAQGEGVVFSRIAIEGQALRISGSSGNESSVITFKERLQNTDAFTEISLPLANIKSNPDGTVTFSVSLSAK